MKTDITIVLDRSGSMQTVVDDTIGGFNRFLEDQKAAPGEATITLHQFDTVFETVIDGKDVQSAEPLNRASYMPRGGTALLDAIGYAIGLTGARLTPAPADKVVFVIITDGEENSSREFTRDKINEMIAHQRGKYGWEIVFLGANQDAIATGTALGVSSANAMTYASNSKGTRRAFESTSANLVSMRSGAAASMAYSAADRTAQQDAMIKP